MAIDFEQIEHFTEKVYEKVKSYREHLHSHPELSYKEYNSSKFVSDTLTNIGIENSLIADTGVVAVISASHHKENQPCIALRADLDALPISRRK